MFNLAACYRLGEGVKRDIQKAISWYEKASEHDKYYATAALADIYATGDGVPKDKGRAAQLYKLASDHGNPHGRRGLREMERL